MQELKQIQPKKVLGQYFLKNTTAIMQSINALRLEAGETIIEIGPGTGALTLPLLKACQRVGCDYIGIEKDEQLVNTLQSSLSFRRTQPESIPSVIPKPRNLGPEILIGDALIELPKLTKQQTSYKIIGNIPYYITGHLLRVISELPNKPKVTVLMLQKEVATRICAEPPEMNLLAAATQIWSIPKLLLTLKPSDFEPQPAVHSAVIELKTKNLGLRTEELNHYYAALHRIFKQPRKMLINNLITPLSRIEAEQILADLAIPLTSRPQNLSIEQLLQLSEKIG